MKMKKCYNFVLTFFCVGTLALTPFFATSQSLSGFENLVLPADSFWNGSDLSGGFQNGTGFFVNHFTDWGGGYTSWDGFAYSNMNDSITSGYMNQYSTIAGSGYNGSQNFAVGYCYPTTKIRILQASHPKVLHGVYVTNNTYSAISMRDGDAYSKKFGGSTGNDPDWFKLNIWGYANGQATDTVNFYLADYRFANNDSDYIVKNWSFVDLSSIGNADSLEFSLASSDNDSVWGMRTPSYFCLDNLLIDFLPENETGNDSIFLNHCGDFAFNLDTFFVDLDTPDSMLTYEIIYNSNQPFINAYINENILNVFVGCLTKNVNWIFNDTIVIRAHSAYGFTDIEYHFSADIVGNVSLNKLNKINFFPNPVVEYLQIITDKNIETLIYDISGKKVWSGIINHSEKIDVSYLIPGMYFISCQGIVSKFIKM